MATLFGLLWPLVEPCTSAIIQDPWDVGAYPEHDLFYGIIVEEEGTRVPQSILAYLRGRVDAIWRTPASEPLKRAFLVMRAIDRALRYVLPETAYLAPRMAMPLPGPLLRRVRDRWLREGCLAHVNDGHVVLLGPLTGKGRAEAPEARNGDVFAHQFVNVTFVRSLSAGRRLTFRTLAPSEFTLLPTTPDAVGLAPIAQDHDDLAFTTETRGGSCYLDARPADASAAAARTAGVVSDMLSKGAKIVALPELVLDPGAADLVRVGLRLGPQDGGRIVVLGTGLASDPAVALPFNEAVVIDGRGRVLYRQRKLNHYSMSASRMRECRIAPLDEVAHIENCSSGTELCVCDIPGIGRLMVLICEDFAQPDPARRAAQDLSPDWIVTPVLDLALSPGRWTHQKAFALETSARIVVSGSTALSVRKAGCLTMAGLDQTTGVAMLYDGGQGAAVRIVTAGCMAGVDRAVVIEWRPDTWDRTRMGASPVP